MNRELYILRFATQKIVLIALLLTAYCLFHTGKAWGGVVYFHPDHLGSSNILVDENGDIAEGTLYYPYGETFFEADTELTQHKYTDQERDDETELYYCHARYYDSSLGNFLSTDPVKAGNLPVQYLADPQQHNTYAYARNNPLIYTDPTGEFICGGLCIAGLSGAIFGAVMSIAMNPGHAVAPEYGAQYGEEYNSQSTDEFMRGELAGATLGFGAGKLLKWGLPKGFNIVFKKPQKAEDVLEKVISQQNIGIDTAKTLQIEINQLRDELAHDITNRLNGLEVFKNLSDRMRLVGSKSHLPLDIKLHEVLRLSSSSESDIFLEMLRSNRGDWNQTLKAIDASFNAFNDGLDDMVKQYHDLSRTGFD